MNSNYRASGNPNMNRDFSNQQQHHQSMNPKMQQGGPLGPGSAAIGAASAMNGVDPLRKQAGSMMNGGGASSGGGSKGPAAPTNLFGNKP